MNTKSLIIGINVLFTWMAVASVAMSQSHDAHTQHETQPPEATKQPFQTTLSAPEAIKPDQMFPLTIHIQDANGQKVMDFAMFQEKLMHLIVVSADLGFFTHLHPEYKGNGDFETTTSLPAAGAYNLFIDYKPAGQSEQVSVLNLEVAGTKPAPPAIDPQIREQIVAETKVRLTVSPMPPKIAEETMITFVLSQATTDQPVTDLQPYLGEKGHLVIIKQSPNLTPADYLHAHAMKEGEPSVIQFMTHFPQPGLYKLWGQFNRGGRIITADFWVAVEQQPEQADVQPPMMHNMMGMMLEQMANRLSQENVSPETVKQVTEQLKQMAQMMKQMPMMGKMAGKGDMKSMMKGKKMCKMMQDHQGMKSQQDAMQPMMGVMPMMQSMMDAKQDPKMIGKMMQMHGEMMKAMAEIMMKYGQTFTRRPAPAPESPGKTTPTTPETSGEQQQHHH